MKRAIPAAVAALVVLAVVFVMAHPLAAGEGETAKKVVAVMKKVKLTLVQAVARAEKETGGKAVKAQLEADDDEIEYEVVVVVVKGDAVTFRVLDIDAVTGKILDDEVIKPRRRGDHDDDDDDDEDDGEDDDDDDEDDD